MSGKRAKLIGAIAALLMGCLLVIQWVIPSTLPDNTRTIGYGDLSVWATHRGVLDAREVRMIMSMYEGTATVVELAEEGSQVSPGDLLVRFDSSSLEYEVIKFERNHELALSALQSLESAELPLELRELEMELVTIETDLAAERQFLVESVDLAKEGLVSSQEVSRQREKVHELETQHETLALRLKLTREYLHPAALRKAQAELATSEQELSLARRQLERCVIRSPASGIVVYKPHYFGSEYRTIRIGDSVYPNQPFMFLPDMKSLIVVADIPEAELSRVQVGNNALVRPLAFPGLTLHGAVERIGSTAQLLPGQPDWQKYFRITIGVTDADPRLRPGMSVTARVLAYHNDHALLVPRTGVLWEEEEPFARVVSGRSITRRKIELGAADERNVEVLAGLEAGERVLIE